jgi:hypothetical protein
MLQSAWVTLGVAFLSATAATVLGTLAAIALVRLGRFRGRLVFSGMIYAPLVMPEVIIGLSLLLLFVAAGIDRGFWTIAAAHSTLTMCFVTVIVQSRLLNLDPAPRTRARPLLSAGAHVLQRDAAADPAGARLGLDLSVHIVARRPHHRELHHRAGRHNAADPDLFRDQARRETGDQRHLHGHARNRAIALMAFC